MRPWVHAAHHAGCATGLFMAGFHLALREPRWAAAWAVYGAAFALLCHHHHHRRIA